MDCGPTGKGEVRSYKTFSTISRMCIGTLKWFVERKAVEDSLIIVSHQVEEGAYLHIGMEKFIGWEAFEFKVWSYFLGEKFMGTELTKSMNPF